MLCKILKEYFFRNMNNILDVIFKTLMQHFDVSSLHIKAHIKMKQTAHVLDTH